MFIAHLPAGYLVNKWVLSKVQCSDIRTKQLMKFGLIASVLPDVDLAYAVLIDHSQIHHHRYITHWPSFWVLTFVIWAGAIQLRKIRNVWPVYWACGLNITGHLFLDWIVGKMWLLAPFSDATFNLIVVPARHHPWYMNFFWFWTAWIEVLIVGLAVRGSLSLRRMDTRSAKAQ